MEQLRVAATVLFKTGRLTKKNCKNCLDIKGYPRLITPRKQEDKTHSLVCDPLSHIASLARSTGF